MEERIRGIVLRTVKYGDASLIVDMFTESHGRMAFMTSVAKAKRSSRSMSFWRPLNMIEFQADIRPNSKRLARPMDVQTYYNYSDMPFSPIKSALAIFLAEFTSAALSEEKENDSLYSYLQSSFQWLDMAENEAAIANFHLAFIMNLTRFIGIYPNTECCGCCFDLLAGTFTNEQPFHSYILRPEEAQHLPTLFRMNYSNMHLFRLSRSARFRILTVLNSYYKLHLPSFPDLKSLDILHELFD